MMVLPPDAKGVASLLHDCGSDPTTTRWSYSFDAWDSNPDPLSAVMYTYLTERLAN